MMSSWVVLYPVWLPFCVLLYVGVHSKHVYRV